MSSKMLQIFKKITNLNPIMGDNSVNIGFGYGIDNPNFVIKFFQIWVSHIDSKLSKIPKHSVEYADLLGKRGFTFQDFRLMMSGAINESDYDRSEIFDVLYIDDAVEREKFKYSLSDDNSSIDQYLLAISKWMKFEHQEMKKYFCETKIPLNLSISSLQRHVYILASSGSGKSELMKLIFYDLQKASHRSRNRSLILLEPHSTISADLLQFCMNKRYGLDRVVYLDPNLRETAKLMCGRDVLGQDFHFVINPLENRNVQEIDIPGFVEYISNALFSIIDSRETFQMETIIDACVETIFRKGNMDMTDLKRFMDDSRNEDLISYGSKIPNLEKAEFIGNKFRNDGRLASTKSSISMRLQKILGNSFFKQCFTGKSTFNLESAMNSGKVIIINLNKARLGKSGSSAAGKLLIALISAYSFRRMSLPENQRMATYLFIDEFQNYVTPSIEELMAETRKFKLFGILAHQQMGQNMNVAMKRIISGNTAIKIVGDNEPDSLDFMTGQMKDLTAKTIENLPKFAFYVNDRMNKAAGSFINRVPNFLINKNSKYYLKKPELEKLFLYLANESGIYRPSISSERSKSEKKSGSYENPFTEEI